MTANIQLIHYARTRYSSAINAFLFKNRNRLNALIDDLWRWKIEGELHKARASRMQALRAAAASDCVCEGRWFEQAAHILMLNNVSPQEL